MKSLLQIVRESCRVLGVPVPGSVIGNPEPQVAQMLGLMEKLLTDLEQRSWWETVVEEATFTSVANESQGLIEDLAPYGFVQFLPDTFFDRTTNLKVATGLSPEAWQAQKASSGVAGPFYMARIRNGQLFLTPTPPAGDTMAFEYHSRYFIRNGSTRKASWSDDGDLLVGPDGLGSAWLCFRWKREKGLDYAEDQVDYETLLANLKKRDNAPPRLNMAGEGNQPRFGVIVPQGNWPL